MKYSGEAGRFVAARADVAAGDTLAVEEPYAAALYPEKFGLNCQGCFARLRSVVPCQGRAFKHLPDLKSAYLKDKQRPYNL